MNHEESDGRKKLYITDLEVGCDRCFYSTDGEIVQMQFVGYAVAECPRCGFRLKLSPEKVSTISW